MDDESLCLNFLKNPNINPKNGVSKLIKDKTPYFNYIKLCRKLGYNDEVDELLKISESSKISKNNIISEVPQNKIGLFGWTDIDQEIILNSDYISIINLLTADPSSRNLIYKLLPDIIKNNNIRGIYNDWSNTPLNFLTDLLTMGQIELIKRVLQLLGDKADDYYSDLGDDIANYPALIENYLKSAPINYNWDRFLRNYLDEDYNNQQQYIDVVANINVILEAAINVKNYTITEAIEAYWQEEGLDIVYQELVKTRKLLKSLKST